MNMHRLNDDSNPRNERQTDARRVTVDDNDTYNGGGACATHTTLEIEARRRTTRCAHIFFSRQLGRQRAQLNQNSEMASHSWGRHNTFGSQGSTHKAPMASRSL